MDINKINKTDILVKINSKLKVKLENSGVETTNESQSLSTQSKKSGSEPNALLNKPEINTLNNNKEIYQNLSTKFNSIQKAQQAALIRELLNIPSEMKELLVFLLSKKKSAESIDKLIINSDVKINMGLLQRLLETNSKDAMNKLIKLFQQAPGGTENIDQMKEIIKLLSILVPKKDFSPQEVLTNVLLLYLPFIPLSEKQNIEIKFEKKKEENAESDVNSLVIYISTINLGRFRIAIYSNKNLSLKVEVENIKEGNQAVPNRKEYIEKILKLIKAETQKEKITTEISFLTAKKKGDPAQEKTEHKREVIISPVKDISPVIILTAQKIAKIILEVDEKASLHIAREGMVNE